MKTKPATKLILLPFMLSVLSAPAFADITVYAAASLTDALTEVAKRFEQEQAIPVKLSFASSSALAKQI